MSGEESTDRDKRDVALDILSRGVAMIHLDPRYPGVLVPPRFRTEPMLRLNFAYGFNLPNFDVSDHGVGAVLNFNGERYSCWVPWPAIFAITAPESGQNGRFWPASAPPETRALLDTDSGKGAFPAPSAPPGSSPALVPPGRPSLRLVSGEAPKPQVITGGRVDGADDSDSDGPPRPPRLRIVK